MATEIRFVDEKTIRRLFNEARYAERAQTGEFTEQVLYEEEPSHRSRQSRGTRSQRVAWFDTTGGYMATVHQFLRADGSLAASGLPDPKRVRIGSITYVLAEKKQRWRLFGRG